MKELRAAAEPTFLARIVADCVALSIESTGPRADGRHDSSVADAGFSALFRSLRGPALGVSACNPYIAPINPYKNDTFSARANAAASAKTAIVARFRARPGPDSAVVMEQRAAHHAVAVARETRAAERKAAREAEVAQQAAAEHARQLEQTAREAEEAARIAAHAVEQAAQEADNAARAVALAAEQKAARDARYAARAARRR